MYVFYIRARAFHGRERAHARQVAPARGLSQFCILRCIDRLASYSHSHSHPQSRCTRKYHGPAIRGRRSPRAPVPFIMQKRSRAFSASSSSSSPLPAHPAVFHPHPLRPRVGAVLGAGREGRSTRPAAPSPSRVHTYVRCGPRALARPPGVLWCVPAGTGSPRAHRCVRLHTSLCSVLSSLGRGRSANARRGSNVCLYVCLSRARATNGRSVMRAVLLTYDINNLCLEPPLARLMHGA